MKKILSVMTLCAFFAIAVNAQSNIADKKEVKTEKVVKEGPMMSFEDLNVDFGTIEKDSEPFRYAKFTNTGTEPLVIKNCRGSCGCTVPTWPKEPILPGESGEIKIRYATNRVGKINKTVKITTNAPEGAAPLVLKVIGKVLKPTKEESVPKATDNMIKGGK